MVRHGPHDYFALEMSLLDRTLDLFDRHKYGIIGTLMLHTLLLFVLNVSKVRDRVPQEAPDPILLVMDSDEPAPDQQQEQPGEAPLTPQQVTNLASNTTAETSPERSLSRAAREQMAKSVEKDLLDMEKEEFDRLAQERKAQGKEITVPELDPSKFDKNRYMDKTPKPVKVEGLTTVSYDLVGRTDIVLDVPAYLCKGSGKVVVRVAVDRTGSVTRAEVDAGASTTVESCMVDNALASATGARFSSSSSAPQPQRGTITYIFLAQ
jgi:outer membrane biosynthesis protein TonB